MLIKVIIQLILSISVSKSSHFYGGTITWKPMNNTATGSMISVMFTQSYQFKRSIYITNGYDYCNETIIINQSPKIPNSGQTLTCISASCANYVPVSINEYCTDFSVVRDSSSGQISTIQDITVGAKFCVAFQDSSWTTVYSTVCVGGCFSSTAGWSIVSCLDLTVRSDGFINTPPVATVISPVKVPINTITNIKIPIIDTDGDYLRCRWGENSSTINECGSVCKTVPGGTIDSTNCILTFDSSGKTVGNYYAAAMMVEDFSNAASLIPFSSVPIQFLIQIVNTSTCPLKPTIDSTLSTCTALEVGVQFNFTLTITAGCSGTTVTDVNTNPPLYMYKGSLTRVGMTDNWTIGETWIPTADQLGSQVYCALATESTDISSDQYCLTFFVLPAGSALLCPSDITTTFTTTTSTSTTSMTSATTTTVTTLSTTLKTGNKSIDPWPIIGSILGLLTLCALCCCCWWWLFCGGRRRRQRRRENEKSSDEYLVVKNYHSNKLSSSTLKNLRQSAKATRISSIELHHRSLPESRTTTIASTESSTCHRVIDIPPVANTNDSVSVTHVKQSSKPLFKNGKNRSNTHSEMSETLKSNDHRSFTGTNPISGRKITIPMNFKRSSSYQGRHQKSTESISSHMNKSNGNVTVTKVTRI